MKETEAPLWFSIHAVIPFKISNMRVNQQLEGKKT